MSKDKIIIENLEIDAHIGITEKERQQLTRLRIDAHLTTSLDRAAEYDDISNTIDYATLRSHIKTIVKNNQAHLLETLASKLIETIKETFKVEAVEIKLCKLNLFDDTKAIGITMKR